MWTYTKNKVKLYKRIEKIVFYDKFEYKLKKMM